MARRDDLEALRHGAAAWNAWRAGRPHLVPDLRLADLRRADLTGAHLAAAQLHRARLHGAILTRADLRAAQLHAARLHAADLAGADLRAATLGWSAARGATLAGADLRDADLRTASWRDADLDGADLRGADLSFAVLSGATLRGAQLAGADLTHTDLTAADLTEAELSGARLRHTRLLGATVHDGTLDRAADAGTALRRPDDAEPFTRTAARVVTTEPAPGHVSSMFACQWPGCGDAAGWVAVIAKGVAHPDDAVLGRGILDGPQTAGHALTGGFVDVNSSSPLEGDALDRLMSGLRSGDVLTVWEESEGYAPFYCTRCRAAFCSRHCQLREVWDDDWGMTPDYWTGACPNGHRIFVDH